jgi:hypothetical protein
MYFLRKLLFSSLIVGLCSTGCKLKEAENESEHEEAFSERDEMLKAMQQEFMMTVDPALGYVPKERLTAAIAYERKLTRMMRGGAVSWSERGPSNISGRTRAVVIDSRDNTGNTIFSASVSGGIWKATNFKTATNPNWVPVSESMGSLAVCALAQDPSNPNILYAGTGEGWFNIDAVKGNGIWSSTDGGSTWNKLASTDSTSGGSLGKSNFDFVQDIVVNSQGIVFASCRSTYCNRGGIFRSADKGTTWARVIGTPTGACNTSANLQGTDLEIASNGDVYACVGMDAASAVSQGHIFKSSGTNGANVGNTVTWQDVTPAGTWQRIDLAISPSNPQVVYALMQGSGDGIGAIKKSTNGGASWTDCQIPNWCNQGSQSSDLTNGQAFYDLIVQVDPTNENTVYIGGIDLFKSTNGGASWNQITQWARNCTSLPVVHADQHNILFFPGSSTEMIVVNDGGIYYSNNAGTTWATTTQPNLNGGNLTTISQKNIGYNITQLYACDLHPSSTDYFLVGSQDNGSLRLNSTGIAVAVEASVGGDGGFAHIDQTNGNLQILSSVYNRYYYSRNGGVSFIKTNDFNDEGMFINPSDLDDSRKVLYSGYIQGQLGLVSNLTAGTPSFSALPVAALGTRKISAIKIDPTVSGGGTIWVAGYDSTRGLAPNIIKLTNANVSPVVAVNTTLPVAAGAYVSSIDVDAANANHLLVTLSNYGVPSVFESMDGGLSWTSLDNTSSLPDIPVRWGMFVPSDASVGGTVGGGILLATEVGVWFAQNSSGTATSWTPQNGGLPNVRTDMLRYRSSDNLLAVATHGRGLFTTNLTSLATGIPTVPNTKNFIDKIIATPQQLTVEVGNLNITNMEVRIFAIDGKLVYSSKTNYSNQRIPLGKMASGSYIIKIYGNKNEQFTKQFIK